MNNASIGIFDSGLGGLTVLQSLEESFPNESFIYFGDTARVPYGNKSAETVIQYSLQIGNFLQKHDVKMIIVACNTSSALALNVMKKKFDLPIFGVIGPAVDFVEKSSNSQNVVVLGTRATINSNAYSKRFALAKSKKNIIEKACPLFVPIIEEGIITGKIAEDIIKLYLEEFKSEKIEQFILGCTHYPLLKTALQNYLGIDSKLTTSGEALVPIITQFMEEHKIHSVSNKDETQFYITDFPQKFNEIGSRFLGRELKNINFIDSF